MANINKEKQWVILLPCVITTWSYRFSSASIGVHRRLNFFILLRALRELAMEKFVRLEKVGMAFKTRRGDYVAVKDVNLAVGEGTFVSIIGHSGCGKSTVL